MKNQVITKIYKTKSKQIQINQQIIQARNKQIKTIQNTIQR